MPKTSPTSSAPRDRRPVRRIGIVDLALLVFVSGGVAVALVAIVHRL